MKAIERWILEQLDYNKAINAIALLRTVAWIVKAAVGLGLIAAIFYLIHQITGDLTITAAVIISLGLLSVVLISFFSDNLYSAQIDYQRKAKEEKTYEDTLSRRRGIFGNPSEYETYQIYKQIFEHPNSGYQWTTYTEYSAQEEAYQPVIEVGKAYVYTQPARGNYPEEQQIVSVEQIEKDIVTYKIVADNTIQRMPIEVFEKRVTL